MRFVCFSECTMHTRCTLLALILHCRQSFFVFFCVCVRVYALPFVWINLAARTFCTMLNFSHTLSSVLGLIRVLENERHVQQNNLSLFLCLCLLLINILRYFEIFCVKYSYAYAIIIYYKIHQQKQLF